MTGREDDLDELLQPTVKPVVRSGYKPWRVHSQFWVAFFGGIFAVTGIAYINAGHLGAGTRTRRLILLCGAAALAIFLAMAVWAFDENVRQARIPGRILSAVLFLALARLQREADNRYQIFEAGEYASLWGAGIVASIAGNLLLALVWGLFTFSL